MDEQQIITEIKDKILRIEINRPEKKNALTLSMKDKIAEAIWRGEQDLDVRVIVIHGQDNFSTGADIKSFSEAPQRKNNPWKDHLTEFRTAKKPLIAAVSGYAIGAGTTLLFHCDLVYASDDAKFRMPFVNLGLSPENGSSILLPLIMGHHKASELLLFGEFFDAKKAYELGIVNAIFPKDQLLNKVFGLAKKLAEQPPESVRITKSLLKRNADLVKEVIDRENLLFHQRTLSAEHKEATTAFFEKRKPDFSKIVE